MNISKPEWRFVWITILIVLIISSIPFIFAYASAPSNQQFMGFILNAADHGQYLAWYKAFQTQFLTANIQTSEPNPPVFFNLLWFILGRIGYYTRLPYDVIYQGFRLISGAALLVLIYRLVAFYFEEVFQRRTAFLFILLGSGLGWILVLLKYTIIPGELLFPLDIYISEGNTFFSVMASPHFAEASAFILGIFILLLIGEQKGQLRYAVGAGFVALLLGWQHGYDLIIVWAVPSIYGGLRWLMDRKFPAYWVWGMLIVGSISFSGALYSVLLTRISPIWEEVLAQFDNAGVFTPNLLHIFILMGIPLMLAVVMFFRRLAMLIQFKTAALPERRPEIFLLTWFIVGWALCYIPTDFQIHMLNSWQVPVGLLATLCFFEIILPRLQNLWKKSSPTVWAGALLGLVVLTNAYLLFWRVLDLSRHNYPYYLHRDEVASIGWLETNSPEDAVILSAYDPGTYIPGLSNRRAFLSHWAQTVDFWNKRIMVEQFFNQETDNETRIQFLDHYKIDYIFYGPAEQALGEFDPGDVNFLKEVYGNSLVKVYALDLEP